MILVPLRTVPGLNAREHWRATAARVKKEKIAVGWSLLNRPKPPIPCSVRLTRVSPARVETDDDNLPGALKAVRDRIAEWLGVDDRHRNQVRYVYAQKKGPWGVEIEFGEPVEGAQFALLDHESIREAREEARVPF